MARNPKLNSELIDEILTYKENGLSDKDVCDMVGISQSAFYEWLREAETGINAKRPDEPVVGYELKVKLYEGLKRAKAAFKAFHIQQINRASKKSWQASAWILERMYPREFSRIDRQIALMGDAKQDDGMLSEILDYLRMTKDRSGTDEDEGA